MQSEYRQYADLEASLRSAFVATPHLVRFVALTANFGLHAWAAAHAPVAWQKEQAIERLGAARVALFAAFEEEGVEPPTPRVPLGMAVQIQNQIDEEAATKEGAALRGAGAIPEVSSRQCTRPKAPHVLGEDMPACQSPVVSTRTAISRQFHRTLFASKAPNGQYSVLSA